MMHSRTESEEFLGQTSGLDHVFTSFRNPLTERHCLNRTLSALIICDQDRRLWEVQIQKQLSPSLVHSKDVECGS